MESTIAKKLGLLKELQSIDTALYDIKKLRGALPEEMRNLEDSIAGLETRIGKLKEEIKEAELLVAAKRNGIKEAEAAISKSEDQQENVRNNREYDAISKQIELKQLEIQLGEKQIKDIEASAKVLQGRVDEVETSLTAKREEFGEKGKELEVLVKESEEREATLLKSREALLAKMEEHLKISYQRLLSRSSNGLAVVSVRKGACGGCFSMVPPQRQLSIREGRKIVVCEHCGRILVDVEEAEGTSKVRKRRSKKRVEEQ